jgi:uncharacterized cupin superfamily protein
MLQQLGTPNAYFWSKWDKELSLPANGYFFVVDGGNVVINPLPCDEPMQCQIADLGGIAKIVLLTPGHASDAAALAERHGAAVVAEPTHEQELCPGMMAIRLQHQSRDDEFAIHIPAHRAVVVGDALLGAPAGSLSLLPDAAYVDVQAAALGLRRILRTNLDTLLVGHGQSIFTGAYDAVYRLLHSRAGASIHRINVDELDFHDERDEREQQPVRFQCRDAEVGFVIGARKLGYRVSTLEPGHAFCPLHSHGREEELFFVLDGEPSVRTLSGSVRCRKGDFIALPVGVSGTHQLLNESGAPATVLLLARTEETDACYYPDSDKVLVDTEVPIVGDSRSIMVRATPRLDYFDGE